MTPPTVTSPGVPGPCLPLAALSAKDLAAPSQLGLTLHVDCRALPHRPALGVCHQVSQLLLLRRDGYGISLHHVHPVLRHCLRLLRVTHLFTWAA